MSKKKKKEEEQVKFKTESPNKDPIVCNHKIFVFAQLVLICLGPSNLTHESRKLATNAS